MITSFFDNIFFNSRASVVVCSGVHSPNIYPSAGPLQYVRWATAKQNGGTTTNKPTTKRQVRKLPGCPKLHLQIKTPIGPMPGTTVTVTAAPAVAQASVGTNCIL